MRADGHQRSSHHHDSGQLRRRRRRRAVIELLGVGVTDRDGRWLLHQVCSEMKAGQVTVVVSRRPAERAAFLDAAAEKPPGAGR